ncbi:MAG: TIGR00730 family Rossman fold protein [Flavobacteriales bacterium CG_4_9_14_0_2_um_filter_35_242]|nr:TIGR00730 family Rossman fold protein [Zetaproteobacteria bacterium]NDK17473.1 TIGR00730 family Rossman fold protein [Flavobacteriales bacterium]OIO10431.1 MAG: Rossman fold protein, TIGR00730 family [Flavobacteriaceae bacterium CG1_02_35_72]PIR14412.1 MAG: TIGR00730 family Rossman fold protein [Flavobacteriales bacterium CG11_big_fil_rev_8_21_14_0_20_35_7]PIV16580.1 MAG: TIGR00730 family Rossman fold protein [Flavobacteriales bacterium CG03_land_8_20_14_0_80_35_15]PIX06420.1 MAG: TIGR00730
MKNIAVFCGSSIGFNADYKKAATTVGLYFAKKNIGLVYGGGKIGMMGALADALLSQNGHVTGVIPHLLKHKEVFHGSISEMIVTKNMSERKVTISKMVDGYIALAGGFGTLDELFEALTLGQLGIENKPIGLLNTNGFFDFTLKQLEVMVAEGFLKKTNCDMLQVSDSIEDLIAKMENYIPPIMTKVVNTVASK